MIPPAGTMVMVAGETGTEEAVTITSSARSFGKYSFVSMGVLRESAYGPGTTLGVITDDQKATGTFLPNLIDLMDSY
tara:strand:+ start:145 stop:375 length:231 start_codon:yes stop_codon:yes gene_type:complete